MKLAAILLALATVAHADEPAREHYDRGAALYDATRYASALQEFETAYTVEASPALIYDIARCLDHLGRRDEAAAAYTRFLDQAPDATTAASARGRLAVLGAVSLAPKLIQPIVQITQPPPAPTPPRTPLRHRYLVPGLVGGGALALGAIGAGLLGSALVDYGNLSSSCSPNCTSSSWSGLPGREHAGEALLGVAGAIAIVDVVLFIVAKRRK